MDDLDHSIHIVEFEWMSFYEACEECSLLLPSIAGAENSNLSDSEQSWSQDYSEPCDSMKTTVAKTNPIVVSLAVKHSPSVAKGLQFNQIYTDGQTEDFTDVREEERFLHTCLNNPLEPLKCSRQDVLPTKCTVQKQNHEIIEMVNNGITMNETLFVQQTDSNDTQCSSDVGAHDMLMLPDQQSDIVAATTIQESKPLTGHKADMSNGKIQCTYNAEKTLHGKDSSVSIRKKEHWFVTVNVPLQGKRRKKKNTRKRSYPSGGRLQKPSLECRSELKINKSNEVEGLGPCEPLQDIGAPVAVSSTGLQIHLAETKQMHEVSSLLHSEGCSLRPPTLETISEAALQSVTPPNPTLSIVTFKDQDITLLDSESEDFENHEGLCLVNICNSSHLTAMLPNAVILKSESIKSLDSMEPTDFKSSEVFSSSHVSDCESYASAFDLTEDTCPLFKDHRSENKPEDVEQHSCLCTLLPTCDLFELSDIDNVPNTDDSMLVASDIPHVSHDYESLQDPMSPVGNSFTDLQCDGCKTIADREYTDPYTVPAMTCPPVGQRDNSTSANETLILMSQTSDSTPVESCSLTTEPLQSSAIFDPSVTPCSMADSPEAYAESLGHSQPVYAMSAFWDEMEKLTIRDILQLRLSGEQSSREALNIHDTARPHDNDPDMQTDTNPQSHTVECVWSDTASVDPSDIADSDYFTNTDDSKPDHSSCDVSTSSDLDEEYWNLLGSSRDTSPELHNTDLHMQSKAGSPSTCDSSENTTPVNEGTIVDPHTYNSFPASQTAHVRGIQKSKSMHNVHALTSIHQDTSFEAIPENGDDNILHINDLSMQNISLIKVNDVLIDRALSNILSNIDILDMDYQISFPEVFEHLFDENKTDNKSKTVSIYGDQSISCLCDCTCSLYGSEGSLLSVQDSQWIKEKPIPIFTCSGPSVRDLTFPGVDYLIHPNAIHIQPDVESNSLPVGVVSHVPLEGVDPVTSTAADEALFNKRRWCSRWNRWLSLRKTHFHDSGSSWCRRSGSCAFLMRTQSRATLNGANVVITLSPQRRVASFPNQLFRELAAEQQMLKCKATLSGK